MALNQDILHFLPADSLFHWSLSAFIWHPSQTLVLSTFITIKYTFFMSLPPSMSLVRKQWTSLCPAKATLFCLCGLFYPCANRHGRVPALDPIFHAQLSFVWHTAPDKNPNSSASLILKYNSSIERAFNQPLSVLQWLPFNLPGSMLFITGPRAETVPR